MAVGLPLRRANTLRLWHLASARLHARARKNFNARNRPRSSRRRAGHQHGHRRVQGQRPPPRCRKRRCDSGVGRGRGRGPVPRNSRHGSRRSSSCWDRHTLVVQPARSRGAHRCQPGHRCGRQCGGAAHLRVVTAPPPRLRLPLVATAAPTVSRGSCSHSCSQAGRAAVGYSGCLGGRAAPVGSRPARRARDGCHLQQLVAAARCRLQPLQRPQHGARVLFHARRAWCGGGGGPGARCPRLRRRAASGGGTRRGTAAAECAGPAAAGCGWAPPRRSGGRRAAS